MRITFESTERIARILDPLNDFKQTNQILEHRFDPLTGRNVIVSKERLEYVKRLIESDTGFLGELLQSSKISCPFCSDALQRGTPKFPAEIDPEGRIQVGEAVCFPSLFAHNDFNAIVVPTQIHNLQLGEFSVPMLVDGFKACLKYFHKVFLVSSAAKYPVIVMNFLPPAGSTIAHPHIQAMASDIPVETVRDLIKASVEYWWRNGVSYWSDLVESEKKLRLRYLGSFGNVHWLTPFAPMGLNEAQAVTTTGSSFDDLSNNDLDGLAEGIIRVLRYYNDAGVRSFNVVVYSGALGETDACFRVNARIVSRYGYKERFVSDVWALQYLLGTQEVFESPEETYVKLMNYFH